MSEFKGTPGEWRADKKRVFFGENPIELRSVHDANLVAAAPDMLEALQSLENDDGHIPESVWNAVKKAIAKARGAA